MSKYIEKITEQVDSTLVPDQLDPNKLQISYQKTWVIQWKDNSPIIYNNEGEMSEEFIRDFAEDFVDFMEEGRKQYRESKSDRCSLHGQKHTAEDHFQRAAKLIAELEESKSL